MTGFGNAPIKAEGEPMFTPEQIAAAEKLAAFSHGGKKFKENAYNDLLDFLEEGEAVEAIVFGDWGWGGYEEPKNNIKKGVLLTLEEAKPMMKNWTFYGGYGAPECPATNIWTNKRVIWVTQYDGSTTLDSALRNPANCMPEMPGG